MIFEWAQNKVSYVPFDSGGNTKVNHVNNSILQFLNIYSAMKLLPLL